MIKWFLSSDNNEPKDETEEAEIEDILICNAAFLR